MAASRSNSIQNENLNLNSIQTLINHIFCFIGPKITNNIPLETLQHVESISALIFHSFSIQIESIFKLNQTYLLVCLIHNVCSKCPKITNL
jgi:hypothetical protein